MLKIFLTNLGKYNEGYLIGEWVGLPVTVEELEAVKKRIGINRFYDEIFITDYESDIDGVKVNEYSNIDELNGIASMLEDLDESEQEIISALLSEGYTMEEAFKKKDDCFIFYDCDNMTDIAYKLCDDFGILCNIPEELRAYFDFEAYGRDLALENTFIFTDAGNCVEILY